jgi:hypothetical protein
MADSLILIFNHQITPGQEADARIRRGSLVSGLDKTWEEQ